MWRFQMPYPWRLEVESIMFHPGSCLQHSVPTRAEGNKQQSFFLCLCWHQPLRAQNICVSDSGLPLKDSLEGRQWPSNAYWWFLDSAIPRDLKTGKGGGLHTSEGPGWHQGCCSMRGMGKYPPNKDISALDSAPPWNAPTGVRLPSWGFASLVRSH